MELIDLNRDGGIGANCLFVQLGDFNLMVDCGLHPKRVGRVATPDLSALRGRKLDLIIITHCHLDHIGSLPVVMREHPEVPVIMTAASLILIERMLHNSARVMLRQKEQDNIPEYPLFTHTDIEKCVPRFVGLPFGHAKKIRSAKDEIEIILHPAGHVAGAAGVEVHYRKKSLFLTGDVMYENQRTLDGAKFPAGHFDVLVTETTRGDTAPTPDRTRTTEINRLLASITTAIKGGGSFLLPVFALGRMQEILTILHEGRRSGRMPHCPIYASGLGMALADYLDECTRKTPFIHFNRQILKELQIRPLPRKLKAGKEPARNSLYLVSSGMMVENTPSYLVASGLLGHERNGVGFVGYCDPDTPGGKLLQAKTGDNFVFEATHTMVKLKARVERFALSGHAEREELLAFAVQTEAKTIVLTHGDPPARRWFKQKLAEGRPQTNVIDPVPLQTYPL